MLYDWITILLWSIPYLAILISDSKSPWKMVLNNVHITLFGWITFFVSSIPYWAILISDSKSHWKMVSNDIYIIPFGWIPFFWPHPYHIGQFWYRILSLLEELFLMISTSSDFAELPFLALSIPHQAILILDSESPWTMVSNGIHIILFGWITFFGLIHTILGDSDIRFWISLKNCFYWYILCCITIFGPIYTI